MSKAQGKFDFSVHHPFKMYFSSNVQFNFDFSQYKCFHSVSRPIHTPLTEPETLW